MATVKPMQTTSEMRPYAIVGRSAMRPTARSMSRKMPRNRASSPRKIRMLAAAVNRDNVRDFMKNSETNLCF